jgi:hypothetical protein
MDWKASLDRYLTTPPEDGFSEWVEAVVEEFSDEFYQDAYEERTDWENSDLETSWFEKLSNNAIYEDLDSDGNWATFGRHTPKSAAQVIERAYKLYKI